MNRVSRACGLALALLVLIASPAAADAPGPTDYLSEVVSVDPPTDVVSLQILGGDSFLELVVAEGHAVDVIGYRGERYLRFEADGTVLENQNSPSKYLNEERYGTDTGPDTAVPEAAPDWKAVATGGSFAWHDHRTHWMNDQKPANARPGDIILESVVPLIVDGAEVDVTVVSVLQARPSPTGVVLGVAVAAGIALALARELLPGHSAALLAGASAAALVFGTWAFVSVPGGTGPSLLLWLMPALALSFALGGWAKADEFLGHGALLLGGGVLAGWGWLRRGALVAAIIPSHAPDTLDRAVVAAALVGGAIAAGAGLLGVVRVLAHTAPTPATGSS
ncbi:MAG: hypothetical protein R2706_20425 [Acidimicrobiales bacterium]